MKRIFIICLLALMPINIFALEKENNFKLSENAKSAIIMEVSTGKIIYKNNENEKAIPASMTKMMSMILIMEAIEKGNLDLKQKIQVSEHASSMGGSQILLEQGEKMTVEDLLKGVAIASGNDAVVALAEAIAGTEEAFVDMMNEKAKELKLQNTNFETPHGLDCENHYSSAKDMALIARELIVKYPNILKYTSVYEDYLREGTDKKIWLVNTNKPVYKNYYS